MTHTYECPSCGLDPRYALHAATHAASDSVRGWLRERLLLKLGEPAVPRGPLRTPGAAPADRPLNERTREGKVRICREEGCDKPAHCKRRCLAHYAHAQNKKRKATKEGVRPFVRGERAVNRREDVTDSQLIEMRAKKMSYAAISRAVGLHPSTIHQRMAKISSASQF